MRLFENLRYIVLDELHTYRGVFGSHLGNVLRRLKRVAKFYGSDPQFTCCSATIANPGDLASQLIEKEVEVIEENGAPAGEKLFVFYNPPMVNRNLGIRRSYINEATRVAKEILARKLQTIVFANSRLHTEVLLTYLKQANPLKPGQPEPIRGYRQQYHIEHLDFDKRKAYVKPVNVDYYTDAIRYTQVRVLEVAEEPTIAGPAARAHGDVLVRSQVVGFKKIKFFTNENVGSGKLELPENEMHTTSFWLTLGHSLLADLPFSLSERQSGIFGLLYALGSMATLLMMCDRRDLGTAVGERPPSSATEINWEDFAAPSNGSEAREFFEPNLYIYDAYPGGIGFSEPLYRGCGTLLSRTLELINVCPCENGCPSCVGSTADRSERTKEVALEMLGRLCRDAKFESTRTEETA